MGSTAATTGTDGRLSDAARLRRLHDSGLLDGGPWPSLDRLARTAAHHLRTARGQVSLIAADRRVVAGTAGPPVSHTFCRMVVDTDAPLLVSDARTDDRVAGHPAIGDGVVAYAGFPLRSHDGYPLGAFCVLHDQPRDWEPRDLLLVEDLAAAVGSEIALRAEARGHAATARRLQGVLDGCQDAYVSIDLTGAVREWNAAAERLFGYPAAAVTGCPVAELIIPERFRAAHEAGLARLRAGALSTLAGRRVELTARNRHGAEFPIEMTLQVGGERFHAFLHDISGRAADRRQLDAERTFLQALLDSLDTGVAACDAGGRPTLANRAMAEIHRHTGQRPEAEPLARAHAGERVDRQHLMVAARHFHANGRRIETADGRRLGAVVALHDITDHHRAETARDLRLAVARALADATSAAEAADGTLAAVADTLGWAFGEFWLADEDAGTIARVGHWISPAHDLSAVTADRPFTVTRGVGLAGHIWANGTGLWAPEVADDPRLLMRGSQIRAAGLRSAIGLPVRSADRVLGVLLLFGVRVEQPDPEVLDLLDGVCGELGRYFERRRAEDLALALAAARRDFDRVIEQVSDYVWTVEVRPDGSIHPVYGSPGGQAVVGASAEHRDLAAAMEGRVHPDDREQAELLYKRVVAGEPAENEVRTVGPDGVVRWLWTRAMPRREDDRLLVDGITTDVTDRHLLAEERDRLKDELVALVSHELRNPLAAIRNYTEELLHDDGLTADQRHLTQVIDKHSAHMQHLVDDLLDLARLEAGELHVDPRPTAADALVEEVVQSQHPAATAKQLTVRVAAAGPLPVRADPVRLRQVLDNLLSNAVKYTPPGGTVTVAARSAGGEVVLTVTDTGIGIPAEDYPNLFDRFFRASNAVRQGIKGTGLGLAITRAIVEAHGGRITATPADGGGTVFTVTLPADGA